MSVKLHLILKELVIGPSSEWTPDCQGWILIRVADGAGYWLKKGTGGDLNVGDGIVLAFDDKTLLRASVLSPMKIQFFAVYPQYLGLLTIEESHRFKTAFENSSPCFLHFRSNEPTGQEFARLVEESQGSGLSARCALLQFWANIAAKLPKPADRPSPGSGKLGDRFRRMLGQLSVNELCSCSPLDLAQELNCSVRHFRRLFREEFGVPFRVRQTELGLWRAQQLLAESDAAVSDIANQCGYHHVSFFNSRFKKRFGMTPGAWRHEARKNLLPGCVTPFKPG